MNWNQIKDKWKNFTGSDKNKLVKEKSDGNDNVGGKRYKTIKTVMNESK